MPEGLDEIEWSALQHAYGSAEGIPELLRGLGSADSEEAEAAWDEVLGSLFHQGTVYPATVPAIPFLVELAGTATHRRAMIVGTVGMLADPQHAYGDEAEQVRTAVRAQADRLRPLLHDPDPEVRTQVAYTLARCGDAVPVEVFRQAWDGEESPQVKASLLLALATRDPVGSVELLRASVHTGPPSVRVAAGLGVLRTGLAWPEGAAAALAEALLAGGTVDHVWRHRHTPLDELVADAGAGFAAELATRLLGAADPAVRRDTAWSLGERCRAHRRAPAEVVPLLAASLSAPDIEVRDQAVWVLRRSGRAAGIFADALAGIAANYPRVAGDIAIGVETHAVQTLALLGDPRWLDPLCAAWAAGHQPWLFPVDLWGNPANLALVRRRLAELATADRADPRVVRGLAQLLGRWGPGAAEAAAELREVLPVAPETVSRVLVEIGVDEPTAEPWLRAAALAGDVPAGVGLWRLDGDAGPLLAALEPKLSAHPNLLSRELAPAAPAGAALGPLLPRLSAWLTGVAAATYPEREVQVAAAEIAWRVTGDLDAVLPTVTAVLDEGDFPARSAAALAGRLGAGTLVPPLRRLLADRWASVDAVEALWRLGEPVADLVPTLLAALRGWSAPRRTVPLLVEMGAVSAVPELTRLVEQDGRLSGSGGGDDDLVWQDERLRDELRAAAIALGDLTTTT